MTIQVRTYQALTLFLQEACGAGIPGQSPTAIVEWQRTLDKYQAKKNGDVVNAIVESLECRETLLKLSSEIGLANDSNLRAALRTDEEWIMKLLMSTFNVEEDVLLLEGESAQCFLDVAQDVMSPTPCLIFTRF
ncbi:hypothetical protein B0H16DRAFT_886622 [Mycena metata]|uniref:Uncharacterized protein n=1 Tax=Mycena metata TaxID=1033252 RepID=A0AAD7NWT6_9AGAR|nr:hypothetical protein B0H16DRAFT_886622 [Mycena metata]